MKRKRIVTALLGVSMLFGLLAGCGGGGANASESKVSAAPEQKPAEAAVEGVPPPQPVNAATRLPHRSMDNNFFFIGTFLSL